MQLDNPVLIGVYVASITAITSVITNLITTFISNFFQDRREGKNQLKSELQNIYSGSIKSLATLLTLSGIESNLDTIELSIVEAKKWLALSLIYSESKYKELFEHFEEETSLFILGQYEQLLEKEKTWATGLQPLEKYQNVEDVYAAADIMIRRIMEVACQDKRLY
jgi:hypothetical protein